MTLRMFDLAGADPARRFSPYCWRIKTAAARKGIALETIAWRFTEKAALEFAGSKTVPVITDGATSMADSWKIALHLDHAYPGTVRLMDSEQARGAIRVFALWVERVVQIGIFPIVLLDLYSIIDERDKAYFRDSREKRFGMTLEAFASEPAAATERLKKTLEPVRVLLGEQDYIGGRQPSFADDCLFGAFQWARCVSPKKLLAADDPIYRWRERMLDADGGHARAAIGYAV